MTNKGFDKFGFFQQIALFAGLTFLIPTAVYQINDLLFPMPKWEQFKDEEYTVQRKKYDSAAEIPSQKQFYVNSVAGLALLFAGPFCPITSISAGLMMSGVITLGIGFLNHWNNITKLIRLFALLIGILSLIWVGFILQRKAE